MLGKYRDIVGKEEVGGGRDEDLTAVVHKNSDTAGVAGATSYVPNDFLYERLDIESSGGMAPASLQAPLTSLDRRMIGNSITGDGFGSPSRIKELYFRFK